MKVRLNSLTRLACFLLVTFALFYPHQSIIAQDAGYSLDFDGSDDFVELGDILNDVQIPFSVSTWMRLDGGGFSYPIRIEDDVEDLGVYYGFWLFISGTNDISIHFGDGTGDGEGNRRSKRAFTSDLRFTWYHITAVVEGPDDMSIYVNGEDIGGTYEGGGGADMARSSMPGRLGRSSPRGTYSFNGELDEFRIYNRALNQEEIRSDMHRTIDPSTDGLVAYWSFNEGEGQLVSNNIETLPDGILGFDDIEEGEDPVWSTSFAPISTEGCITTAAYATGIYEGRVNGTLRGLSISGDSLITDPNHNIILSEDSLANEDYVTIDIPEGIEGRWNRTWCFSFSEPIFESTGSIQLNFDPELSGFGGFPTSAEIYRLLHRRGRTSTLGIVTDSLGTPLVADVLEDSTISFTLSPGSNLVNGNPIASGHFTIGVIETPLPVELTAFSGVVNGSLVHLNWTTASETNNAGFYIERSLEGGVFDQIQFVAGAGTSLNPTIYQYTDDLSNFVGEQWTYRLKQVDFDGTFEYSDPVELRLANADNVELHPGYPNPFNAQVIIQYDLPRDMHIRLAVYDMQGRELRLLQEGFSAGGRHQFQFDAIELPSGVYSVRLDAEHDTDIELIILAK